MQGDVIAILDSNGAVAAEYEYDAWGNCTVTKDTNTIALDNPIRYRGYYYDVHIGLYYLQSRYYDANTGRFINADEPTLIGANGGMVSNNLFAYCDNNPVNCVDYSGYLPNYVITISDFWSESILLRQELSMINGGTFNSVIYECPGETYFRNKWNSLAKGKGCDILVINSHATPSCLKIYGVLDLVTTSNVKNLKKIKCKVLILLGCNAGMWKSTTGNSIAYELSKKITGIVVASDGTVSSLGHRKGYAGTVFESRVDKNFNNYSHRTYNLGMLVYKNGQCFMTGIYRFDMKIIIDYLKRVYKVKF